MQPLKVIIFEDEFLLANDLKRQIEQFDFKVVAMFRKGEDGLSFLEESGQSSDFPDVALMDISLAGRMTGIETARLLVEKFNCALVFLTGMSQMEIFEEAFEIRPNAFLIKPFDIQQALVSIRLAVYQKSLENRLQKYEAKYGVEFVPETPAEPVQ